MLVAVDCLLTFYCDGCVVVIPSRFRVRKYDNSLHYRSHNVLRYHTKHPRTFVFRMMRSTEKVTLRVTESDIVAQNDRLGGYKYMHFDARTPIDKIVCEMFTKRGSLVVLDENPDSIESPLF